VGGAGPPHAGLRTAVLAERAVLVHLAELLPVGVVELGREERGQVVVVERIARDGPRGELRATCMARRAHLDLAVSALQVDETAALSCMGACPLDVLGSRSVAGLTAHVD